MYGKIYESLFTGSLVGAGAHVFAVISYVIANQKPDRELGSYVELNPTILAVIIGESEHRIQEAIDVLCSPDPKTTTPGHCGRRLEKVGSYGYQVVNGAKYRAIRDEEERRRQNRESQRRRRDKLAEKKMTEEEAEQMKVANEAVVDAVKNLSKIQDGIEGGGAPPSGPGGEVSENVKDVGSQV